MVSGWLWVGFVHLFCFYEIHPHEINEAGEGHEETIDEDSHVHDGINRLSPVIVIHDSTTSSRVIETDCIDPQLGSMKDPHNNNKSKGNDMKEPSHYHLHLHIVCYLWIRPEHVYQENDGS